MRDFDAAWSERNNPPVPFRAFGREFVLPKTLPAVVPLRIQAIQDARGENAALTAAEVAELAPRIIGQEAYDYLLEAGASLQQLADVITWAVGQFTQTEGHEGNPATPTPVG